MFKISLYKLLLSRKFYLRIMLQKFGNLNKLCQIDYLEQSYIRKYKNSFLSLIKIKMLVNLFSSLRYL